jgi:hypothetical protein
MDLHYDAFTPEPPLEGAWLKVDRAGHHLATLDQAIAAWNQDGTQPYALRTTDIDRATGWAEIRLHESSPLPLGWGVIVGDAVHNLRSALDHLAWQVVSRDGGDPTEQTMFPIVDDAAYWSKAARRRLPGASYESRSFFEELQPYQRSRDPRMVKRQPLYVLRELSNIDKHRVVHPAWAAVRATPDIRMDFRSNLDAGELLETELLLHSDEALHDGMLLLRARFPLPGPKPEVRLETELPLYVGFGDDDLSVAKETLPKLVEHTAHVLALAKVFFFRD